VKYKIKDIGLAKLYPQHDTLPFLEYVFNAHNYKRMSKRLHLNIEITNYSAQFVKRLKDIGFDIILTSNHNVVNDIAAAELAAYDIHVFAYSDQTEQDLNKFHTYVNDFKPDIYFNEYDQTNTTPLERILISYVNMNKIINYLLARTDLAGKNVLFVGLNPYFRFLTSLFEKFGSKILISYIDGLDVFKMYLKGYEIMSKDEALKKADIILLDSNRDFFLKYKDFELINSRTIVMNASFDHKYECDVEKLFNLADNVSNLHGDKYIELFDKEFLILNSCKPLSFLPNLNKDIADYIYSLIFLHLIGETDETFMSNFFKFKHLRYI